MSTIALILIGFELFALSRTILRYGSRSLTFGSLVFWGTVWCSALVATAFPNYVTERAQDFGAARGIDLGFLIGILLLFYLIFRLYVKMDRLDKDVTRLVIELAKQDTNQKTHSRDTSSSSQ